MSEPKFSVIIAVYNGEATIARAIDSVLSQTRPPCEVIVVDDGSTDATADVVARYGNQVKYVHQPNQGVSAARNHGAELAQGDWLAFLDADDCYYPQRLQWHSDFIMRDPQLDFLTGDQEYRQPDGALIKRSMENTAAGRALLKKSEGQRKVVMEGEEMELFVVDHFGDTHTLSVPRYTFMLLGGYPLGFKVAEDVHFLIRLCAASKRVGVICEPMAIYYVYDTSATRADPIFAQAATVTTLMTLKADMKHAPTTIRRGYAGRLRQARLNYAYALLKAGRHLPALTVVLPSLLANPGMRSLRDVLSILKGPAKQ